jgi:hydrogenase maturation factor HypF (carbamoyltransferase family)
MPRHHSRILEKVFTLLKEQQNMGKIKQFFGQRSNVEILEAYGQELNHALEIFKVHPLEFISVTCLSYYRFELPA